MAQQVLSRSMHRLLRSSNVPTSPSSIRRAYLSQPLLSFVASSGTPRWWPSSLARPTHHVSRFPHGCRNMASSTGVNGKADAWRTAPEVIGSKPYAAGEIVDVTGCKLSINGKECLVAEIPEDSVDDDDVPTMYTFPYSSHRDGSIYIGTDNCWKRSFHIADRSETHVEAMRFSNPTNCIISDGVCMIHRAKPMLQIFSLRLAKVPVEPGSSVELYGYIAVRDGLDALLNYVVNVSRDDPIIVKQGSLINMSGPKRGVLLVETTVIEYDMKMKTGKHENEDLQLIDGVSPVDAIDTWNCSPFTNRIHGDWGAIDLTAAHLYSAVEATVEVVILQVKGSFNMRLSCLTSGINKEFRLFNGAIGEPCRLKRSVVAVVEDSEIELRFEVYKERCVRCCSFKANRHGHANEEIESEFALFAVKVTWSTMR